MAEYTSRPDQTEKWLKQYAKYKNEVMIYLEIINEVFRLGRDEKFKIMPNDSVDHFFQTLRSRPFDWTDNLEYELLKIAIEKKLHCSFNDDFVIAGRTFGTLFEETIRLLKGMDVR